MSIRATHTQFDTEAALLYDAYRAATGAFLENHCSGFGTNSTPNHPSIVDGETPTRRNPPQSAAQPEWDMPSLPGHAQDHGPTCKVYAGSSGDPVSFDTQLEGSARSSAPTRLSRTPRPGRCPRSPWSGMTAPTTSTGWPT